MCVCVCVISEKSKKNLTGDKQADSEAGVEEVGGVALVGGGQRPHCQPQVHPWLKFFRLQFGPKIIIYRHQSNSS